MLRASLWLKKILPKQQDANTGNEHYYELLLFNQLMNKNSILKHHTEKLSVPDRSGEGTGPQVRWPRTPVQKKLERFIFSMGMLRVRMEVNL